MTRSHQQLFVRIFLVLLLVSGGSMICLYRSQANHAQSAKGEAFANPSQTLMGRAAQLNKTEQALVADAYAKTPLSFEENKGQTDKRVGFLSRGSGYTLFLTQDGATLSLRKAATEDNAPNRVGPPDASGEVKESGMESLEMKLVGSDLKAQISGEEELPGKTNYFTGNDPSLWRTGVSTFRKVRYREVYKNIDLVYYGNQRRLEYDLIVAPGGDPGRIKLSFKGAQHSFLDENGDLVLRGRAGDVRQQKPLIYQEIDGAKQAVAGRYKLLKGGLVGFEIGSYVPSLPLVIDPVLVYSTYLGGVGVEDGAGIAVDSSGSAYITGYTSSPNFPTVAPLQSAKAGETSTIDAFVAKLNPAGNALVYSTFIGGNSDDAGTDIALDANGNAYISGYTLSTGFPTVNPIQGSRSGIGYDAFALQLNATGSALIYSTYLGGMANDIASEITVDTAGNAYLTGGTSSADFITTAAPFQSVRKGTALYRSTDGGSTLSKSDNGLSAARVNHVAVDPTNSAKLYAATDTGVFRSTDGGDNWSLASNGLSGISPVEIAIDPITPSTLYAATQGGIFKSADGGTNWSNITTPQVFSPVRTVAVDPINHNTVYAGTIFNIVKSTDGGGSWTVVGPAANSFFETRALAIDPINSANVYAATARGIYKSTNSGGSWSQVNTGFPFVNGISEIAIDRANPSTLYAYGPGFGVYKTSNGAANWSLLSSSLPNPLNALITIPTSSSTLFAATAGGLYKSTDGGTNWSALSSTPVMSVTADPSDGSKLYVGGDSGRDLFITMISPSGALSYSTFLGGSADDVGNAIVVDDAGNICLAGSTTSSDFPTMNPIQAAKASNFADAFVLKFNPSAGSLVYSTYLGGGFSDTATGIALDSTNNVLVTGNTSSTDFPTLNPLQTKFDDNFSTDVFVTKLKADGSQLLYSTYLGGDRADTATDIAVDASGNAYVVGSTSSYAFPALGGERGAKDGSTDAFILKLNPADSSLRYSRYLGGSGINDTGGGVAVDSSGNAYLIGTTQSTAFPTASPIQAAYAGSADLFVAKVHEAPDISVTMTDSPDPVAFGSNLTYTINLANSNEMAATGVALNASLPQGSTLVSSSTSRGACGSSAQGVVCNIGNLAAGESVNITIVVTPPAVKTISATVTATLNESDANTANNSATQTTDVLFAELSVVKTAPYDFVSPGANLSYLVTVTNQGGITAHSVVVTDALPVETTFVACGASEGTCTGSASNRTVTIPSLDVGKSVTVTLTARVNDSAANDTVINNTASVTSSVPDPNPSNNSSTAAVTVTATPLRVKTNGKIAFASDRAFTNSTQPSGVYQINSDATGELPFPGIPLNAGYPSWSPDGTKLAFRYVNFNNPFGSSPLYEIRVINADGTGMITVAQNAWDRMGRAAWSPNGRKIAYVGTNDRNIYIVNSDGTGMTKLPNSPSLVLGLDWSPDGSRFIYTDGEDIYVMNVDGSDRKNLTSGNQKFDITPRWSPDGTRILFTATSNNNTDIYVMNADGTEQSRLFNVGASAEPCWSPDGTRVVFESLNSIYVMTVDGTSSTRITNNGFYNFSPDWQPIPTTTPLPTPPPPGQTFSISGKVTNGVDPLFGIQVTLSGARTATLNTKDGGAFSFVGLPAGGNYTVTVADVAWNFNPTSLTFNNLSADQTNANFVGTYIPLNITGRVTDTNGAPIPNVKITSSGGFPTGSTFTDADGHYAFNNVSRGRSYTIFPQWYGPYTYEPSVKTLSNPTTSQVVNFVGTKKPSNTISGRVTRGDAPTTGVAGVAVFLAIDINQATFVFTDANGYYTFGEMESGLKYSVYLLDNTHVYTPNRVVIDNLNSNQTANFLQYEVRPNRTISGRITDGGGNGMQDVLISLSGAYNLQTLTGSNGEYSFLNIPSGFNYELTPSKTGYAFTPRSQKVENLAVDTQVNFVVGTAPILGFSAATYNVNENETSGVATISVNRIGDSTAAVSVDYTTSDTSALVPCQTNNSGVASNRCDYATAVGTLRFAAGETSKTIQIPIISDAYVEPDEVFTITLRNPVSASLGTATANVIIADNKGAQTTINPIDGQGFFIRQQYIDFLGRVAEPAGFQFWTDRMTNCPPGQTCDRIDTSQRFFQSDEFQERGFYVYRLYDALLGRLPGYAEFVPDVARLNGSQTVQEQRLGKDDYLRDFINKAEFRSLYGTYISSDGLTALDPVGFVNALCAKSGITPATRQIIIDNLQNKTKDPAHTLEDFILTPELSSVGTRFYDRGFITMQYFGYLRRDPEPAGFDFWAGQLIGQNAPHRQDYRFMVGGFLQSDEYRFRFALIPVAP
jgi:uncharacterized repeat protein (TIGR01451 family)